jgi:hypothetical protein
MVKKEEIKMVNMVYDLLPNGISDEDVNKLDEIIDYLEWANSARRTELYSLFISTIVQYFIGVNDELQKIKIYGKNDKGEPYIITVK